MCKLETFGIEKFISERILQHYKIRNTIIQYKKYEKLVIIGLILFPEIREIRSTHRYITNSTFGAHSDLCKILLIPEILEFFIVSIQGTDAVVAQVQGDTVSWLEHFPAVTNDFVGGLFFFCKFAVGLFREFVELLFRLLEVGFFWIVWQWNLLKLFS